MRLSNSRNIPKFPKLNEQYQSLNLNLMKKPEFSGNLVGKHGTFFNQIATSRIHYNNSKMGEDLQEKNMGFSIENPKVIICLKERMGINLIKLFH